MSEMVFKVVDRSCEISRKCELFLLTIQLNFRRITFEEMPLPKTGNSSSDTLVEQTEKVLENNIFEFNL